MGRSGNLDRPRPVYDPAGGPRHTPPWMHLYEMQTDPDDWSQPGLLGLHITVEHFGTVLTASPLPCHPAAIWIWLPATSYRARVRSG
ncbi:MAG: LPD28 domain-containing protein [Dysosmobacter welbionis]